MNEKERKPHIIFGSESIPLPYLVEIVFDFTLSKIEPLYDLLIQNGLRFSINPDLALSVLFCFVFGCFVKTKQNKMSSKKDVDKALAAWAGDSLSELKAPPKSEKKVEDAVSAWMGDAQSSLSRRLSFLSFSLSLSLFFFSFSY